MNDHALDALEAELGLDPIEQDPSYGGLLDSLSQAFMYDRQLLEARQARKQARMSAQTARAQRRKAAEERRAMRAQTATVKSQASQERLMAREQARAEQQRVAQERARKEKEAQRLAQMRVATKQEVEQQKTAREGQQRDTAEARRSIAQIVNLKQVQDASADPSRVAMRAGAPIETASSLSAPVSPPTNVPSTLGAEPESGWGGYAMMGALVLAFAGAVYLERNRL